MAKKHPTGPVTAVPPDPAAEYRDGKLALAAAGCRDEVAVTCPPDLCRRLAAVPPAALDRIAALVNGMDERAWQLVAATLEANDAAAPVER